MIVARGLLILLVAFSLAGCSWLGLDNTDAQLPATKTQTPPAFQAAPIPDRRYE